MTRSPQNVELLHDFALGLFLSQELLINRLERDKFCGKSMDGQVDFTKRAFSHHFADFVILCLGLRRATCHEECELDFLVELADMATAGRNVMIRHGRVLTLKALFDHVEQVYGLWHHILRGDKARML